MYEALKAANAQRWSKIKLTKDYSSIAHKLVDAKARYMVVQLKTGVPWPVIAVIHERESSQNFNTQLAQGDPLSRVSTHVPRKEGPYLGKDAWERSALIALEETGGKAWKDWSIGGALTFLEKYNGMGYYSRKQPSPYVWAGTNQYKSGKFVSDGVYSATTVDTQPGCANLLMAMSKIDTSIQPLKLSSSATATTVTAATTGAVIAAGGASVAAAPQHWHWVLASVIGALILIGVATIVHHQETSTSGNKL